MNAGEYLLAKSSLSSGTAALHLLSTISGGTGVVVNDGISMEVSDMNVEVEIEDTQVEVNVNTEVVELELDDQSITVEVEEW